LIQGYFYHRNAFSSCFYEKQTFSRNTRALCRQYEREFGVEQAYEKIYSKHFKRSYNGVATKLYAKLLANIMQGEQQKSPE